ncbi:MAG: V4R domain-containing protein [Anaerolineae bacterium]
MSKIPLSGYHYPNKIARIYLLAMEEVMGKNGLNAVLNMAGLSRLIDNYPPDNLAREFDFAEYSALNAALEEIYGSRGGRGLGLRAGRASFKQGLSDFGSLVGMADLAFKLLPLGAKLKVGLKAMAETFSKFSDQISRVEDEGERHIYIIERCPVCWGRKSEKPCCYAAIGLLQEGLKWVSSGKDFRVEEITCVATGDPTCNFAIYKEPLN